MKKFRIVILSVILGLLLCACGEAPVYSEIQTKRMEYAGMIATSYGINIISEVAMDPDVISGVPYTDYTYDELEKFLADYIGFNVDGYAFANAVDSFQKGISEAGEIVSIGEPVVTLDGNEIIVDVECLCETRYADIEMIFTNDVYNPRMISAAFNARYTLGEKMSKAGLNTVIGMGTVFIMLIVIAFIISLLKPFVGVVEKVSASVKAFFAKINAAFKKKDKAEEGIDKAVEQIVKNETAVSADAELVAVIAAAVAAYEGTTDTSGFVVRSIRKIKRQ